MITGIKIFILFFAFTQLFWQRSFAQSTMKSNPVPARLRVYEALFGNHPGASAGIGAPKHPTASPYRDLVFPKKVNTSSYTAYLYTFNDIVLFSYFDNTNAVIIAAAGDTVASIALNADSFDTLSPGNGIYFVNANQPYAVLTGDAITSTSSGYFAIDENGYGTGAKFDTWMMGGDAQFDPHFIIFAYDSGTSFTMKDLGTGDTLPGGIIDSTGYFDYQNVSSIQNKALQVISNNPVSVLSYTDQGYYVPSSKGTFAGNLFYGFSGYESRLQNSITIISYSDSNIVAVINLTNGDTLSVDTLNHWQVQSFAINVDTFWKIVSTGILTAANIPFEESWENQFLNPSYYYLDEVADSTGKNIGTSFIVPTTQSDLSIFSYDDNNEVQIIELGGTAYPYESPLLVKDTVLENGGVCIYTTPFGDFVYRIQSNGKISVVQSSNGDGASFMTVNGTAATGVIATKNSPTNFVLRQNFPNPFNPSTVISYQLLVTSRVTLRIYDILGREVATLVNEKQNAGTHAVMFDGSRLSSGVYFYRLTAGSFTDVKKLVLLR